jgi:hypothetical protein
MNEGIISGIDKLIESAEQRCKYKRRESGVKRVKQLYESLLETTKIPVGIQFETQGDINLRHLRRTLRRFRMTQQQLTFSEIFVDSQLIHLWP